MSLSVKQFELNFELYLKTQFYSLKKSKSKFNTVRVDLPLTKIWKFNNQLVKNIFSFPEKFLQIAEASLNRFVHSISNFKINGVNKSIYFKVNWLGPFGYNYNSIISLGAFCIGELICLRGLVVNCGKIKIKKHQSVFFCNKNQKLYLRPELNKKIYYDSDQLENSPFSNMEIEYGLSEFFEQQKVQDNCSTKYPFHQLVIYLLQHDLMEK